MPTRQNSWSRKAVATKSNFLSVYMNSSSPKSVQKRAIPLAATLVFCCAIAFAQKAEPPREHAPASQELLGINMARWMDDDLDRTFTLMEELKVKWVRSGITWDRVEPAPGKYDWEHLDHLISKAHHHNVHLLVTLRAFSTWAGVRMPQKQGQPESSHAATPPKDTGQFARFVKEVVTRYKGQGIYWQIENEPNLDVYWLGTREEYVQLLKAAHAAIHEADPHAVVVSAGIACEFFEHLGNPKERLAHLKQWFDAVLESRAFDVVDMHNYFLPEKGNPWGITFDEYIRAVKGWMKEKDVRTPLWITEFAYPSGPLTVRQKELEFTPEQQARFLGQAESQARAEGVQHIFWMFMRDTETGQGDHLGLATKDGKHKQAWGEFLRLTSE